MNMNDCGVICSSIQLALAKAELPLIDLSVKNNLVTDAIKQLQKVIVLCASHHCFGDAWMVFVMFV